MRSLERARPISLRIDHLEELEDLLEPDWTTSFKSMATKTAQFDLYPITQAQPPVQDLGPKKSVN